MASPKVRRVALTAVIALFVGLVGAAIAPPTAAQAHTADIKASATCVDGNYKVTFTLTLTNVPSGAAATVEARSGTSSFQGGWSKSTWSDWEVKGTNIPSTQKTVTWERTLPGSTTGSGPWEYAVTTWSSGHVVKSDTRIEGLKGDCKPPFSWDWEYAAPTCVGLTVSYPTNIPNGSNHKDVNIRVKNLATGEVKTFNFHDSDFITSGKTVLYKLTDHSEWSASWTWYEFQWTQVHGTNYHWEGSVTCGQQPPPEPEVVTPNPPTALDVCGIDKDTLSVPSNTVAVTYTVTDERVNGVGSVKVKAQVNDGYVLKEDVSSEWTFVFTDETCPGVTTFSPEHRVTCEALEFIHPEFRHEPSGTLASSYTYRVTLNGVAGSILPYTAGTETSLVFPNKYQATSYEVAIWAHYPDGKPFEKHQIGVIEGTSKPCSELPPGNTGFGSSNQLLTMLVGGGILTAGTAGFLLIRRRVNQA